MSSLKKCCRYCSHFKNNTCSREPFVIPDDESATLYTFIEESYLRKAIVRSLNYSDFDRLFKDKSADDKKGLIDSIAEKIEDNAGILADEFYAVVHEDIAVKNPDEFCCTHYT